LNREVRHTYTPDLVCFELIIVELKAAKALTDEHRAQVLNYLKVTGLQLGLLARTFHEDVECSPRRGRLCRGWPRLGRPAAGRRIFHWKHRGVHEKSGLVNFGSHPKLEWERIVLTRH
jgi:hypothetical protein